MTAYRLIRSIHTVRLDEPADVTGHTSGLRQATVYASEITVHDYRNGYARVLALGPARRKDGSLSAGAHIDVRVSVPEVSEREGYPAAPAWLTEIVREVIA